jgi:hypothetical protein
MRLDAFDDEYQFSYWLKTAGTGMGGEAHSRCLDFIRWIYKTPDPEEDPEDREPWVVEIRPNRLGNVLILMRDEISVEFDCEGYAQLIFHSQGSPDEMVQRYYQYKKENDL